MSNESIKWKEYIFDYTDTFEYLGMLRKGLPPAILCVCINGGIQGKESNPAIPETADEIADSVYEACLLYTSPSPRDRTRSRMPSSA